MSIVHLLRGYDRATENISVKYDIPTELLGSFVAHINHDEGDNDFCGVYLLTNETTLAIARLICHEMQVGKDLARHDFFQESEADLEIVDCQIAALHAG